MSAPDTLAEDMGVTTVRRHFMQPCDWDTETWFPQRPAWQAQGACNGVDPAVFHPEPVQQRRKRPYGVMEAIYAEGMSYCNRCPVVEECREYALATHQRDGLWGGLRPGQRNTIWKNRRRQHGAA